MDIRPAAQRDIPGMLALLRQVGGIHHDIRPDIFRPDACKYDAAALAALLGNPDRPILIGEVDGAVAGYAFCVVQEVAQDPVLCSRRELYLDDLCVEESCRGQGVATALFQRVKSLARELSCAGVTLNVWCGNESAMAFYKKQGMLPRKIMMELPLEERQC